MSQNMTEGTFSRGVPQLRSNKDGSKHYIKPKIVISVYLMISLKSFRHTNGKTLLHFAAECGREKSVKFLLDNGSDFNCR
jgi:ankyrin repeat protein